MVHVTRNFLMGIIDRTLYINLMTKYYEGIRRVLLKALGGFGLSGVALSLRAM
jgi:hypothetical protein